MGSLASNLRWREPLRAWLADQQPSRIQGMLARLRAGRQSHSVAWLGGVGSLLELVPPQKMLGSESATVIVGYRLADDFAEDCRTVALDFANVLVDLPQKRVVSGV